MELEQTWLTNVFRYILKTAIAICILEYSGNSSKVFSRQERDHIYYKLFDLINNIIRKILMSRNRGKS